MDNKKLVSLLENFKKGKRSLENVLQELKILPFQDIGCAAIDHHRNLRLGFPEVIFGEGKTIEQLVSIIKELKKHYKNFIVTRVSTDTAKKIQKEFPSLVYFPDARIIAAKKPENKKGSRSHLRRNS